MRQAFDRDAHRRLAGEIDVEKEGVGLYVNPSDAASLRQAVTRLAENPGEAREMGLRGRRLCERHFNTQRFAAESARLLREVVRMASSGGVNRDCPSPGPEVSVIIVGYRSKALILDCLQSIQDHTSGLSFEVLVIDNSDDGTADAGRR